MVKLNLKQVKNQDFDVHYTYDEEIANDIIIEQLDSLLFDQLRRIRGEDTDRINELILVEAKKNPKTEELTRKLISEGFYYNDVHYIRFGKSSSQGKDGITVFVDESIYNELFIMTQLDVPIEKCVVSKYENQRCLQFSTCTLIEGDLPYIVIIDEYTKTLKDQNIRYVVERKKTYTDKETGEIKTYNAREIEEGLHDIKLSPFDGSGCHTHEISEKISKAIGLDYVAVGAQIRLPFIKGYSVEFNFREYYKEIGVTKIQDVYGEWHDVEKIDCIWNTSMFKGYKIFKNKYGDNGWIEYIKTLNKYEFKLGISKYSHHIKNLNLKTRMNFQYLQCLDLWNPKYVEWYQNRDEKKEYYDALNANNDGKIIKLAKYSTGLYEKIIKGDKFYTYKFLGVDDTSDFDPNSKYIEAALINDVMLKDPAVKQYIYRKLKKRIEQMKYGKVYASGFYHTACGDIIGYLEYAAYPDKEPIGCLKAKEFYCKTIGNGSVLSFRSPLVCPSEVNDVQIVENNITKKWFNHFADQDVVMLNMYDLSMPQQGGMDTDGDAVYLCNDPLLLDTKIYKTMIIDIDDKITAQEKDYNAQSILEYEMNSRDNRIGEITNVATSILNRFTDNPKYQKLFLDYISLLRIFQGKEIDFLKTGMRWQMNKQMRNYLKQLPYFLLYSYPKKLKAYYKIKNYNKNIEDKKDRLSSNAYHSPSPLNELCEYVCAWEKKKIKWDRNIVDTTCLILDNTLDLNDKELIKKIKHLINDFSTVWSNVCKNKTDKNSLNPIMKAYKKKLDSLIDDSILLANYVIKVSYSSVSTNKTLAWSCYGDTIICNLKQNTPKRKQTMIFEVPEYWDGCYEYLGKYYMMIDGENYV